MKRNIVSFAVAGGLLASLSACQDPSSAALLDTYHLRNFEIDAARGMEPQGSEFNQALRVNYFPLADEQQFFDGSDRNLFLRKAVASAEGEDVQPDAPSFRSLAEGDVEPLTTSRVRLVTALDASGRKRAPLQSAVAQVAYDCWLEAVEEGNGEKAAECRSRFESAIAEVEQALGSDIEDVFIVFFAFDRSNLTPIAQRKLDEVADALTRGRSARVVVAGHADRAGPAPYNQALSERRAEAVAQGLTQRGVARDLLSLEAYGESRPLVPTADGVREEQNRRVEIDLQ